MKNKSLHEYQKISLLLWIRPYWRLIFLTCFLSIILGLFTPVRPWLIQYTIDKYIVNNNLRMVYYIALLQLGLIFIEMILRFFFDYLAAWIGNTIVRDMRKDTYHHILKLQLRQFDKTPIGILTTRTVDDMERISEIFSNGLLSIIADVVSILCILTYMFYQNTSLTLICLIPFAILIISTYFFQKSVKKSFQKVRTAVGKLNAFVQEHFMGIQVIQAFGIEDQEAKKFRVINDQHKQANLRSIFAYSIFFPIVDIVLALSIGLIIWKSASDKIDAGIIVSFILCLNLIFRPLRLIADKYNVIQMGIIAFQRILEILKNKDFVEEQSNNHLLRNVKIQGKVEFKKVHLSYGENEVLKGISFVAEAGKSLALVGKTGSGKTSIVSLINRSYPITQGSIYIDNKNIKKYPIHTLRSQVGIVLQDVFLFSGSIFENLTLHNPNITLQQVKKVCQLIGIDDFIESLPYKYHQLLIGKENSLSLGQKQLLSFARVLLYNPQIIILDEATSSIDSISEKLIEKAISILVKDRTSIIIAHRLSSIEKADKILVVDYGKIVEQGTHEQLLKNQNIYYQLYQNITFKKKD
ncbi:MAG: ABC transporter ATP-binding protein [Chitinophagaceae bacterium]